MNDFNNDGNFQGGSGDFGASGSEDFNNNSGGGNDLNTGVESNFSIPEEYKEKGWTKFFDGKTGDDLKTELFKSYDNSQTLIGKRVEDYLTTTDLKSLPNYEQIKENLIKQVAPNVEVPENAEGYAFNDILKDENGNVQYEYPEEVFDSFGETFKGLGLTKEQGQGILKAYTDFELAEFEKYTNAEELETNINQMFNGNIEQRKNVEGLLKEFLPKEDQEFLQKTAPNHTIIMYYKLAKGLVDKYGFKEGTSNSGNPSNMRMTKADRDVEYNRIVAKMEELQNRPHTDEEMAQYQTALRRLFNA